MDISAFDMRSRSEEGIFVPLMNPITREPLGSGNDVPGFVVRGAAAKSVQDRLTAMMQNASEEDKKPDQAVMERLHQSMIDTAMGFIIRAENLENGDKPAKDASDYRAILNFTFPDLGAVIDGDGNPVLTKVKNEDGNEIEVPKMELKNWPFAKQIIEAAEDGSRFLGKTANA